MRLLQESAVACLLPQKRSEQGSEVVSARYALVHSHRGHPKTVVGSFDFDAKAKYA